MAGFNEKSLVEDFIIDRLTKASPERPRSGGGHGDLVAESEAGYRAGATWKFIPAEDLPRESFDEPLLIPILMRAIRRIDADLGIGDEEVRQTLNELKLRGSGIEGIKQIMNFLKYGVPIKFEQDKVVKYVHLFDYANPKNNEFIISRQVTFSAGKERIRADIVLFIN